MQNPNPNELTPLQIEAIEKETKSFVCPHCQTHLQFLVRVQVMGVHETLEGNQYEQYAIVRASKPIDPSSIPKPKKLPIEIVEKAKELGVYEKFEATLTLATPFNVPNDMERYFCMWFRRATKIKTPQLAIRPCLDAADRSGNLELWAFQNLAAVVKDGYLHSFLPYQFVRGESLPGTLAMSDKGAQPSASSLTLPVWVKTRNGYVAGKGMLFHELKGKAAGAFDNTGL